MTDTTLQERIARAWASMDGHVEAFDRGKTGDDDGRYEGYMSEAGELIALADLSAPAVAVKPLEWGHNDDEWYDVAKTPVGTYKIGWNDGAWAECDGPSMWEWSPDQDPKQLSLSDAKAAAQAHFAGLISPFCVPSPTEQPAPVSVQEAGETRLPTSLKLALDELPGGEWETWSSCSFRRISRVGGSDGDVLCAVTQSSDGYPDLTWSEKQCDAICTIVNSLRALAQQEQEDG